MKYTNKIIPLALLLISLNVFALDNFNILEIKRILYRWDGSYEVAIQDNYAYVATGLSGLQIVDFSNPDSMYVIGMYDPEKLVMGIDISNDIACLTLWGEGAAFIDVSDRTNPVLQSQLPLSLRRGRVTLTDSIAYIAGSYFYCIDFSEPTNPHRLGNYNLDAEASSLVVEDTLAYLKTGSRGIIILNITNPHDPHLLTALRCSRNDFEGIGIHDGLLFCGFDDFRHNLCIFDASSPRHLEEVFRLINTVPTDFAFFDSLAYIVHGRIEIFSISDPYNPVSLLRFVNELNGQYGSIDTDRNILGASSQRSGLTIVNINDPRNPQILNNINLSVGEISRIFRNGNHAFIFTDSEEIGIFDITDPVNPTRVGTLQGRWNDIDFRDDQAYLGYGRTLTLVDLSTPERPEILGEVAGEYSDVCFDGNYMYSCTDSVRTYWIINPLEPSLIGSCPVRGSFSTHTLKYDGRYLYIEGTDRDDNRSGLFIVDVDDPVDPFLVGTIAVDPVNYFVSNNYMFIQTSRCIVIYDLSDRSNPVRIRLVEMELPIKNSAMDGDYLYLTHEEDGISVYRISEDANLTLAGYYNTTGSANYITSVDSLIYVGDGTNLGIYHFSDPMSAPCKNHTSPEVSSLMSLYPNPFNSSVSIKYQVSKPGMIRLSVYDLNGREYFQEAIQAVSAGQGAVNINAASMPSGIYMVRMQSGDVISHSKVVCLK